MKTTISLSTVILAALASGLLGCKGKKENPPTPTDTTEVKTHSDGAAKPAAPKEVQIEAVEADNALRSRLADSTIVILGAKFQATPYCNEDTIANPDSLEVFSVSTSDEMRVFLCPGSLDGVTNVVTLFSLGKEPRTKSVEPLESSNRIEDAVLLATVKELLSAP